MNRTQMLDKLGELVDELIDDNANPDPMSPDEATQLFLDYLLAFDADEFEQALTKIATAVRENATTMIDNLGYGGNAKAMSIAAAHLELAAESWKNRPGN